MKGNAIDVGSIPAANAFPCRRGLAICRGFVELHGGWRGGGGGAGKGEGGGPAAGRGGYGWKTTAELCSEEGLELDDALAVLASRGVTVNAGMTVRQVADLLGVRPSELPSMLAAARPKKTE